MSAPITSTVNGSRLLEAVKFDRHLCGALIASQDNWEELLQTITPGPLQKNVAIVVLEIREALGLEASYALDICQGRE